MARTVLKKEDIKIPSEGEVEMLRELIDVCNRYNVGLNPLDYIQIGKLKLLKINHEEACILGGKADRYVTVVVTATDVRTTV